MTTPVRYGIDVAKAELVIASSHDTSLEKIENSSASIKKWLKSLPEGCCIAIEPTNTFHCDLAIQSHDAGHQVYLLDGYRLDSYRKSVRSRAKTDACDARLILRMLTNEMDDLTPWSPPPEEYNQLQNCLRLRAQLVKYRTALKQSLGSRAIDLDLQAVFDALDAAIKDADKALHKIASNSALKQQYQLCQQVPGIGRITAAGLIGSYLRGDFRKSDAFIAFIGMDVCARDSGTYQGRRLSKQGNPEIRRLLYNTAMAAKKTPKCAAYYQRYLDRGLKKTEALVILGRKLARVAFALIRNGQPYQSAQGA